MVRLEEHEDGLTPHLFSRRCGAFSRFSTAGRKANGAHIWISFPAQPWPHLSEKTDLSESLSVLQLIAAHCFIEYLGCCVVKLFLVLCC